MTKAQLLKLARELHGKGAYVEENPKAPDAAERQRVAVRRKQLVARQNELKPTLAGRPAATSRLLEAAAFVCDVGGDDPSIPQLAEAVAAVRAAVEAQQEYAEMAEELRKTGGHWYARRWRVCRVLGDAPFPCGTVVADGDTLEECAAKLQAKTVQA
jgi:hypothetical protein